MAITISSIEDTGMSMSASGWTRTRQKIVAGSSWEELYRGGVFPQYGSRHPDNTLFRLTSANISPVGNEGRGVQVLWEGTYTTNQTEFAETDDDPWDLDAQEVTVNSTTEQVVMKGGYDDNGNWRSLVNSAGCAIIAETTIPITELSFIYAAKADSRDEAPVNTSGLINYKKEKVAGYDIPAKCGMLLPISATYITEYDELNPGEELRRYWELAVTIRINERTWKQSFLDVGTMALFGTKTVPEPIFQFYETPNTATPTFGCIDDALKVKKAWKTRYPDDTFSWTEITDPLPLLNGRIHTAALGNTQNRYNEIRLFESKPVSWNKYDLPRKRV